MSMIRTMVRAQIKSLGDDLVEVRMSTAKIARDGHMLIPQGARLDNYRSNPVVLWNHDVDNFPVGRGEDINVQGEEIVSQVRFPPTGISARADECRGLVKSGFINGVSVGFDPIDGAPLDPRKARSGMRVTDWELLEFSFCCIPVDTGAVVTARAKPGSEHFNNSDDDFDRRQRQMNVLRLTHPPRSDDDDDYERRQRQIKVLELAGRWH